MIDNKNDTQQALSFLYPRESKNTKSLKMGTIDQSLSLLILTTLPGWFIAYLTELTLVADVAASWGAFLMLRWIWGRIGQPTEMIRFCRIGAAALCAIQNTSWLTASYIHRFSLGILIEDSLSKSMIGGLTFSNYALAIFYASTFSVVLAFVGSTKRLFYAEKQICVVLQRLKNLQISKIGYIVIILTLIEIIMISTGIIGQKTMVVDGFEKGEMPFWMIFYDSLLPVQIVLNALLATILWKNSLRKQKTIWWIVLFISFAVLIFIYFNNGRRPMVFALIAHGYWGCFFLSRRPGLMRLTVIVGIVYPLLSQAFMFSTFIRSADSNLTEYRVSAIEILPTAWERFRSSDNLQAAEGERTKDNLSTRPLVATPLALCMQLPMWQKSYTLGQELFHSVIWSIPGPLIADKKKYPIQENLLYANFPIGDDDTADSVYLSSYIEFGWVGLLIYPILLVMLWYFMLHPFRYFRLDSLMSVIVSAVFLDLFILGIGEGAVNTWFVALRSFGVWFVINSLLKLFSFHRNIRVMALQTSKR